MRTEDGYIINKCLNGDSTAFGFLVDKYKASVYAFAYNRLRNFHDAEDITQEVFIKAYQKLHTLKRWDNFLAWLHTITLNQCKDLIRKRAKRPDCFFVEEQEQEILDFPSLNSYQEGLARESLHEALDALPEMYREVLTLYYLGGMSTKEIAQFLRTSPSAIRQRLKRARAKLKKEMLDMMSTTFEQQRLQPGFTFHIVEMVKHMKPTPSMPRLPWGLPWGLSAAMGIVLAVLMSSPYLIPLTPLGAMLGSSMPRETQVMDVGELPVEVLEISEITFLSSQQGGGGAKTPNPLSAFAPPLAPQAEGGTWTQKADMPTGRIIAGSAVVDGKIYVIGGAQPDRDLSTVESYEPATDTWTRRADMPTAKQGVVAAAVDGIIYVIGGYDGSRDLPTVEAYDPVADTWTKKADMPTARTQPAIAVVDGIIYVIGGVLDHAVLSAVEAYDPATDTWTKKADMLTARFALGVCVVNGRIHVSGGCTLWVNPVFSVPTVEVYDPATDTWAQGSNLPRGRSAHTASVVAGKMYIIGGGGPAVVGGGAPAVVVFSTVDVYDPATDTWTTAADFPFPRAQHMDGVVDGKIYTIGGMPAGPVHPDEIFSTVEEYDPGLSTSVSPARKLPTRWGMLKAGQ